MKSIWLAACWANLWRCKSTRMCICYVYVMYSGLCDCSVSVHDIRCIIFFTLVMCLFICEFVVCQIKWCIYTVLNKLDDYMYDILAWSCMQIYIVSWWSCPRRMRETLKFNLYPRLKIKSHRACVARFRAVEMQATDHHDMKLFRLWHPGPLRWKNTYTNVSHTKRFFLCHRGQHLFLNMHLWCR